MWKRISRNKEAIIEKMKIWGSVKGLEKECIILICGLYRMQWLE
jgi:hypothetical protein